MSDRPNVLFILSDQHNAKVLGHKGHPDVQTPNMDRLAREGVRFDNAIAQNPICTPSRTSFLSGQYCHNHGYYGLSGPNPGGLPNLFGYFGQAGYATEHGIMEKAPGICSDAITRIPSLWRWPGRVKAGHVVEELAEAVDVSTTLCHLARLVPMETSDGKDLSHLLRGERGEVREIAVTEFAWSKSVRKGKYRLVFYPRELFPEEHPEGFGELYDLEADLWETKNLYFDAAYTDVVRELERDLLTWQITTTRPTTTNGTQITPSPQRVTRYRCTVNLDRKIHPDRLREVRTKNYL